MVFAEVAITYRKLLLLGSFLYEAQAVDHAMKKETHWEKGCNSMKLKWAGDIDAKSSMICK